MAWVVPEHSKSRIRQAGATLVQGGGGPEETERALQILNNWRSAHSYPLNTFQMRLRRAARDLDPDSFVVQRLKRVPSILQKLRRFKRMRLDRMQDLGGCRAVMARVGEVFALRDDYLSSSIKHTLVKQDDYITVPKDSGYRSIHMVYRYYSDKKETYNGLLIEIQLRSQIQHAWATAVETVGTFLRYSLKASEGPEEWLDFFTLVSSAFAGLEGTPAVPGAPASASELAWTIQQRAEELGVRERLRAYNQALQNIEENIEAGGYYFLLALQPAQEALEVTSYRKGQLAEATQAYLAAEREFSEVQGAEVVLVAADSVEALRRAYPNYFLDTELFLQALSYYLDQPDGAW